MSAETHRQRCESAIAQSYARHAAEIEAGGTAGIGRRMQLDFSAALLRGLADFLDTDAIETEVWMQAGRALAGGLTGFLMTIHGGDAERVAEQLPGALASIQELALSRLADPAEWIDGDASEALQRAELAQTSSSGTDLEDYILRVAIVVRPGTIATQLTFAPQTTFLEGRRAVEQAAASLEAERAESVNCPRWRNDFVDAPSRA